MRQTGRRFRHKTSFEPTTQKYKKILNCEKGFTMAEMLIAMMVIAVLMVITLPAVTQFLTARAGTDKNTMVCITENDSSGWYNSDGSTEDLSEILPDTNYGAICHAAVSDVQYDRGKAYNTATRFAKHGTDIQQIMAKKILRAACDRGGTKSCDFFINYCWTDGSISSPYCDDTATFLDLTYYLTLPSASYTNNGATYIASRLEELVVKPINNILYETEADCVNPDVPEREIACDIINPQTFIEACDDGTLTACALAYEKHYNRSCYQIKDNWGAAPDGIHNLTYDSGGTVNIVAVNCTMTDLASAAITGCNNIDANLLTNAPEDDCTYGYDNNYNQTCGEVVANWSAYIEGEPYNLTTDGPPPTTLVTEACPGDCIGIEGMTCEDGTIYVGKWDNAYIFAVPTFDTTPYSWNNGSWDWAWTYANYSDDGGVNYTILTQEPVISHVCEPYNAVNACRDLNAATAGAGTSYDGGINTYNDWYLPSENELNLLCTYKNTGDFNGTFLSTRYWSSTEAVKGHAYYQDFNASCTQGEWNKDVEMIVRCVRREDF